VPRSELEKVLRENWGKGLYQVDIRNNGVRKRSVMIEIEGDDYPPMTRPAPSATGAPAQDLQFQLADRIMSRQANDPVIGLLQTAISELKKEIADLKTHGDPGKSLAEIFAASTGQSVKAMELMMQNQTAAADRAEKAATRQQEALNAAMQNLMNVMAENSKVLAGFQQEMFKVVSASQQKESEILLSLLNESRHSRNEDMQEMLQMINVGLNLGSAMSGATTPEEKVIEGGMRLFEKYLDVRNLPAPKSGQGITKEQIAVWAKDGIQAALREVKSKSLGLRKAANPAPAPAAPAQQPDQQPAPVEPKAIDAPSDSDADAVQEKASEAANAILEAIIAFAREGKPVADILAVMKEHLPDDLVKICRDKPEELIIFIRQCGDSELVHTATAHLTPEKMAIIQAMLKG
jgi:hypothetical protein